MLKPSALPTGAACNARGEPLKTVARRLVAIGRSQSGVTSSFACIPRSSCWRELVPALVRRNCIKAIFAGVAIARICLLALNRRNTAGLYSDGIIYSRLQRIDRKAATTIRAGRDDSARRYVADCCRLHEKAYDVIMPRAGRSARPAGRCRTPVRRTKPVKFPKVQFSCPRIRYERHALDSRPPVWKLTQRCAGSSTFANAYGLHRWCGFRSRRLGVAVFSRSCETLSICRELTR